MTDESLVPEPTDTTDAEATPETEQHAWFMTEGQQGEGEAPEWFKADKYKSVSDQAQAYTEAEKKLGAFTGAPEEYELALPEDFEVPEGVDVKLDKDDPLMAMVIPWAKENGFSQDRFQELVGMYVKNQVTEYQDGETNMAETQGNQKALLGANADARLNELSKWGQSNLDPEMFGKFRESLTTAASVEAFEFIIGKTRNAQMPDPSNLNPNLMASKAADLKELESERDDNGQPRFITDPVFRAKVDRLRAEVVGQGEYRQVM